jgi:hypothetical protein
MRKLGNTKKDKDDYVALQFELVLFNHLVF